MRRRVLGGVGVLALWRGEEGEVVKVEVRKDVIAEMAPGRVAAEGGIIMGAGRAPV